MSSICLVAGDPSGDVRAAQLVEALRRLCPDVRCSGFGGPAMRQAGVELIEELTHTAAIGPFDAGAHLRHFLRVRTRLKQHLQTAQPDLVLPVDFGDFNLPVVAPMAKRAGCRVVYYVSPQLWAWGRFRLRWVQRYVDRMLVLFKFEEAFYQQAGVSVTWVGHPLSDVARPRRPRELVVTSLGLNPHRMTVGLLPGSRASEIRRHLPLLLRAASRIAWDMPGVQFLVPKAPQAEARYFQPLQTQRAIDVTVREDQFEECLQAMDAAIVASGTATLETALAGVPMAVVYRTSWPTYWGARTVLRVPHIAIVNVLAKTALVLEFVQHHARPAQIAREIVELLRNATRRDAMRAGFQHMKEQLGPPGAVERAARAVVEELRKR